MNFVGDKSRFALGFELTPDPDLGGSPEDRATWARLQIWVAGRHLTAGRSDDGSPVDAAEVPLAPVLRWLVQNWDPLFHEERLPRPSKTSSAAAWRADGLAGMPRDDSALDALMSDREQWWRRHALGSALPGFRVPDLHIRRSAQQVEVSWDDSEWRSVPRGVQLLEPPGAARLPAEEIAVTWHAWANAVLDQLAGRAELASFVTSIRAGLDEAKQPASSMRRLELAAGQGLRDAAHRLRRLAGVVGGRIEDTLAVLLGLDPKAEPGLVTELTVPVLLYRSAAPHLSATDLESLIRLAKDLPGDPGSLAPFQHPCRPPTSPQRATEDGYQRAMTFREQFGVPTDAALVDLWDLETILLPRLGIHVAELQLDDEQVEGVAVKAPGCQPAIGINRSGRFARTPVGRRMTLAHELGHLLLDVDESGKVGMVSNPWAPYVLERRANAFAAMLLLPEPALAARLTHDSGQWTVRHLEHVMRSLGVGKSTLTWHLHNLDWITESERQAWVDAL